MDLEELNYYYNKFKYGQDNFHNLMQRRVKKILLISTFYDAYIFEHDGRLAEQIVGDYMQLNLTTVPQITSVPTAGEALRVLGREQFDLIIVTMRMGGPTPPELSREIHADYPDLPVNLLLTSRTDVTFIERNPDWLGDINNVFLWTGDSKLFVAMVKSVEDQWNSPLDTETGLVRVILLVEDSIVFRSLYLPLLYEEIMVQTQRLISQELNDSQKFFRMRTRPKVLLADSFGKALEICRRYRPCLLSVISDVEYMKDGKLDPRAGVTLVETLKRENWDVSLLLQSSDQRYRETAANLGASFIHKNSISLLRDLRNYILQELGFGDFIFRDSSGREIERVASLDEMEKVLPQIPAESVLYHGRKNHFSAWLIAHGEFQIARKVRPVQDRDFASTEEHRDFLLKAFRDARIQRNRGKIVSFSPSMMKNYELVLTLRDGSLGGKGRGLAFSNAIIVTMELEQRFEGFHLRIPRTAIIGTDEFDDFMEQSGIREASEGLADEEVDDLFLRGSLSRGLTERLSSFLKETERPLAVRSSSLLEDSQTLPFAGVYRTYMLPNNHEEQRERLSHLCDAVKLVFASVFLNEARTYLQSFNYRTDEEKMAVVIQELIGRDHGGLFYPEVSGVAQSHNFYPIAGMRHHEAAASLALGLGKAVVDGEMAFRYCPEHPNTPYLGPELQARNSQTLFYGLDLATRVPRLRSGEQGTLIRADIGRAERDGVLGDLSAVWDGYALRDDPFGKGARVLTFPNIVKYDMFPLNRILTEVLGIFEAAMGTAVEIEFCLDLRGKPESGELPTFYLLQVRPLSTSNIESEVEIGDTPADKRLLASREAMGHGSIENLRDLVFIPPGNFDRTKTVEMQQELSRINDELAREDRRFVLIGPGRWGSRDRFLGVPVTWAQIRQAGVIVETQIEDFSAEPSQGTHFFHNLTAQNIGYMTVGSRPESDSSIDWEWLLRQPPLFSGRFCIHLRSDSPFPVRINGKSGQGIICKPNPRDNDGGSPSLTVSETKE
jgi:CheY-like chemotaxis protein